MITVKFTCRRCGQTKAPADVRARRDGEDICYWVKRVVGRAVTEAHGRGNLLCPARTFDLYIPIQDEHRFVGQQVP